MPTLQLMVCSTRPGRVGLPVARWFEERAREHGGFEIDFADLAEIDLPMMNEPKHPRFHDYQHEHTWEWSRRVEAADAFAWVMPEYNHGMAAPQKNAIDYLNREWKHKPVAMVSYGGVAAGTRAAQQAKQVAIVLGLHPTGTGVPIPFIRDRVSDDGELQANDEMDAGAASTLDELVALEAALRPLREQVAA